MSDHDGTPAEPVASLSEEGGATVLTLRGELDLATVSAAAGAVNAIIAQAPARVVIDLSGVNFMDSSGIALLLQIAAEVPSTALRSPTPIIRQVIERTGLSDTLPIVP